MTKCEIIHHISRHYWRKSYLTHDEMMNLRKKDLEKYLCELQNMAYENNPQEAHYIQNSKPDTDCVYCVVHHFRKADGITEDTERYAECTCPAICKGLCSVDISATPSPLDCTVTCKGCKHYKGKRQLTLF